MGVISPYKSRSLAHPPWSSLSVLSQQLVLNLRECWWHGFPSYRNSTGILDRSWSLWVRGWCFTLNMLASCPPTDPEKSSFLKSLWLHSNHLSALSVVNCGFDYLWFTRALCTTCKGVGLVAFALPACSLCSVSLYVVYRVPYNLWFQAFTVGHWRGSP